MLPDAVGVIPSRTRPDSAIVSSLLPLRLARKVKNWQQPARKTGISTALETGSIENSARPDRVTGVGFWKATGTDRPIYSSDGSKCIGLKKSLVFFKGKAARGIKTDWMMHEFRLPSVSDSVNPKKFLCFDSLYLAYL